MFEKTKKAIAKEFDPVLVDPAPMPGASLVNIAKALKEDLRDIFRKKENNGTVK